MRVFGLRTYAFLVAFTVAYNLLARGTAPLIISCAVLIVLSLFTTIVIAKGARYTVIPFNLIRKRTTIELNNIKEAVVTLNPGRTRSLIDFSFINEIRSKKGLVNTFRYYGDRYAVKRFEKDLKREGIRVIEVKQGVK